MRIIKGTLIVALSFSLVFPVAGYSFSLKAGVPEAEKRELYINLYKERLSPISVVEDWERAGKYFYLSRSGNLHYFSEQDTSLVKSWPLTRWEHQYNPSEVAGYYEGMDLDYPRSEYDQPKPGPGCLGDAPLRYGNFDDTNGPELVLFFGDDLVVFSPAHERIVFAEAYSFGDWVSREKTQSIKEKHASRLNIEQDAQYASGIWLGAIRVIPLYQGLRGYSKIYQGDFDNDTHPDILAWRKTYKSNLEDEPAGFTLSSESFEHFELNHEKQSKSEPGVTGQYLPQDTESETIQTWLSDNDLTWQAGFPRESECEGKEGELIPEMHDPLLNDSDVLE